MGLRPLDLVHFRSSESSAWGFTPRRWGARFWDFGLYAVGFRALGFEFRVFGVEPKPQNQKP